MLHCYNLLSSVQVASERERILQHHQLVGLLGRQHTTGALISEPFHCCQANFFVIILKTSPKYGSVRTRAASQPHPLSGRQSQRIARQVLRFLRDKCFSNWLRMITFLFVNVLFVSCWEDTFFFEAVNLRARITQSAFRRCSADSIQIYLAVVLLMSASVAHYVMPLPQNQKSPDLKRSRSSLLNTVLAFSNIANYNSPSLILSNISCTTSVLWLTSTTQFCGLDNLLQCSSTVFTNSNLSYSDLFLCTSANNLFFLTEACLTDALWATV